MGDVPPPRGLAASLFAVALASIALEVALVRILSVSLWYHFAWLVVSTAVLGYGVAGMCLALWPGLAEPAATRRLILAFPATIAVAFALENALPFDPFGLLDDPVQALLGLPFQLAIALPFFVSGLVVGGILSRHSAGASRLYAFDLVGAGLGAIAIVPAFSRFGGTGTVLAIAAVALLAAVPVTAGLTRATVLGLVAAALAGAPLADRALPVRITTNKRTADGTPIAALVADPRRGLHTAWNAESRVDVVALPAGPVVLIDGGVAWIRVPKVRAGQTLVAPTDATSLAFPALPGARVLVIGSGVGHEIQGALAHDAARVTAVEINAGVTSLVRGPLRGYVGRLYDDPRVREVTDEGRSYLARTTEELDLILSAHTISNAATMSGALALAESYTLTVEAFHLYLDRLSPRGLVLVTRPEAQLPKLFATARRVLAERGARSAAPHVLAFRHRPAPGEDQSFTAAFLLAKRPLDEATLAPLLASAAGLGLEPLFVPGAAGGGPYRELLEAPSLEDWLEAAPRDHTPATDDRPFFNRTTRVAAIGVADLAVIFGGARRARLALEDAPIAEVALLAVLAQCFTLASIFVGVPFLVVSRRGDRVPRFVLPYFAALGFGYIFAELGLIHRLTVFVGPPTLTFATVVGGMLVSSGLGSALSARLDPGRHLRLVLVIALAALLTTLLPAAPAAWFGLPLSARALIAILRVAVVGVALGLPFPLGLRAAGAQGPGAVALAFGVNGFASVLGSVLTVALAMGAGFTAVLVAALVAYAVALAARPRQEASR